MPISTTSAALHDGVRNVSMSFTGASDGSGNETLVTKVSAASLNPPATSQLKIRKINYSVKDGGVALYWNANQPVKFLELSGRGTIDYEKIGGRTNEGGDTANGDILLSTRGFTLDSSYSIDLEMQKS